MLLTARQQQILRALIEDYVSTAEPVGSRALAKKFNLGISPATLRNEMADLEEEGLVRQPHTSAGRVPSDAGYRMFVNELMQRQTALPESELRMLERLQLHARDLNDILQQTAKLTALLTHCTAIVRAPKLRATRIQYLQLLPLSETDLMLVVLTDQGATLSQLVRLPSRLDENEVMQLTNFLNAHLRNAPLDLLTSQLLEAMLSEMRAYEAVIRVLWKRLDEAQGPDERIFIGNASFLAQQPEFEEASKLRGLLGLLEREQTIASLMAHLNQHGGVAAQASIGHENPLPDLHECSMVTASYQVGDRIRGEIGVIGPTRLNYSRAMLAVETMARHLSETLARVFGYDLGR
ncbi:MAG TPA: heat-inducible transcriptional repressor HrcA [Oscillatoriaceae cyanobacterium]